jgi:hypothetical protein
MQCVDAVLPYSARNRIAIQPVTFFIRFYRQFSHDVPTCQCPQVRTSENAKVTTEKPTTADTTASAGEMIQDLFRSNNTNVNAALVALNQDLMKDDTKCESLVTAGGCFVLVQLLKNCLEKVMAIGRIPAWCRVTKISAYPELTTLHKTLNVIINLIIRHAESRVSITAIGGVEALAKMLKTFPKCQRLQKEACCALCNLTCCSIGKTKIIESGGIEVVLAAVRNNLYSAFLCQQACWVLLNIASVSKDNTWLLISLGGGAAVAKERSVSKHCPGVRLMWTRLDRSSKIIRELPWYGWRTGEVRAAVATIHPTSL